MLSTSLFNGLTGIAQLLFSAWHHYYWLTLTVIALLLGLVIPKLQGNQHLLRNSMRVLTALFILLVASSLGTFLKMPRFAAVTDELVQLGSGMLLIHILGQCVFRVIVPALKLYPPRILEDIIIVLVYFAWTMVRLRDAGLDLSSLITTSAVVTGIVAFSMQETLSNILGGLALQLDQSINIGDWIKVDDVSGRVVQVSWRHTSVRTRNGEVVILPNSLLMKSKFSIVGSEDVQQWRRWINFSLPDSIPPQRIINCIDDALINANIPNVSESPAPQCLVMDLKDGIANYSLRYWLTDPNVDDPTDSEIRLHIYATLQRHGYSLAHPVLDVTTQNDNERQMYARTQEIRVRENTLRKIDLFKDLSDEEISHLANTLIYAPFAKGSIITHQGAVAHWLYVLISGDVDVWYETAAKQRQHLAELNAGSIFGEHGLMTGQPRRATVTARTNVECYRIDKASFEHILQSRPELAEAFANILVSRTQQHVEVPNGELKTTREHQTSQLLDSIRRFFRLDIG